MKKLIRLLPIILLAGCSEAPVDTTRQDTANGIIAIMSGNSNKRIDADKAIQNNNDIIAKYEKQNEFQDEIKINMENANNNYRDTLCTLIGQDEKGYKCDPIIE